MEGVWVVLVGRLLVGSYGVVVWLEGGAHVIVASWVAVESRSVAPGEGEGVVGEWTSFVGPWVGTEVVVVPDDEVRRRASEEVIGMARHGAVVVVDAAAVVSDEEVVAEEHRSEKGQI